MKQREEDEAEGGGWSRGWRMRQRAEDEAEGGG